MHHADEAASVDSHVIEIEKGYVSYTQMASVLANHSPDIWVKSIFTKRILTFGRINNY